MSTREHRLKTWPEFYAAIERGEKTFEVRLDDRGYAVGDVLTLREYDPALYQAGGGLTGREMRKVVTYKMPGGRFGIDPTWCVLGLGDEAKGTP